MLNTQPVQENTYVALDAHLQSRVTRSRPSRPDASHTLALNFLNNSNMTAFYSYVVETATSHGYMETSTFQSFLSMLASCVTVHQGDDTAVAGSDAS
jgi:hypothetical protein